VGQRHLVGSDAVRLFALFAERQRHVADPVQIEDHRVPVGGPAKIRAGVGNVIDERGVEPRLLGGAGALSRKGRGGGEREDLDQPAATDLAALVIMDLLCDKPFHGNSPLSV
jgi:hypothetical protein